MLKLAGSEACAWYGNRGGEFVAVGYVDVYVIVYKYLVIYYIFFKKIRWEAGVWSFTPDLRNNSIHSMFFPAFIDILASFTCRLFSFYETVITLYIG